MYSARTGDTDYSPYWKSFHRSFEARTFWFAILIVILAQVKYNFSSLKVRQDRMLNGKAYWAEPNSDHNEHSDDDNDVGIFGGIAGRSCSIPEDL